ncbi:MAG: hypothetical protein RRY79_07670 [Clostridia bacterium]
MIDKTDEKHRLTANKLSLMLSLHGIEVERKAIYRDIESLIESGIDIKKTGTGYYVNKSAITEKTARAALFLLSNLYAINTEDMEKLEDVLCLGLSEYERKRACSYKENAVKENTLSLSTVSKLIYAIEEKRMISALIAEKSSENDFRIRYRNVIIAPFSMFSVAENLYLCCKTDETETLTHINPIYMSNLSVLQALIPKTNITTEDVSAYISKLKMFTLQNGEYVDMRINEMRLNTISVPKNAAIVKDGDYFVRIIKRK